MIIRTENQDFLRSLRYSSDSQNIALRRSTSLLSIWKEYPRISKVSLVSSSMCIDFSQCSLSIQNRVDLAHVKPEIRMRIFCFFPVGTSDMSSSSSDMLSTAIITECSMHERRNLVFFGPFAVIFSHIYHMERVLLSSSYDETSTRHQSCFPVSSTARELFVFMTV